MISDHRSGWCSILSLHISLDARAWLPINLTWTILHQLCPSPKNLQRDPKFKLMVWSDYLLRDRACIASRVISNHWIPFQYQHNGTRNIPWAPPYNLERFSSSLLLMPNGGIVQQKLLMCLTFPSPLRRNHARCRRVSIVQTKYRPKYIPVNEYISPQQRWSQLL